MSNEGLDFWAVFPTHIPSNGAFAQMSIYITATKASRGNVLIGSAAIPFTVSANQIVEIPIPYDLANIADSDGNKVLSDKSIHIVVDTGQPKVAVFALISAQARSEAYLVLPTEVMGQRYYAMSEASPTVAGFNGISGKPYIIVIATEDNTDITLKNNNGIDVSVHLSKKGDMYEFLDVKDVTGTLIQTNGCQKFAAFSGHSGIAIQGNSADPLIQQLYPLESWGKTYGIIPFIDRNYYYKIIAAENNTKISIDGVQTASLNAGEVYVPAALPLTTPYLVTANLPISIAQFAYSQSSLSASSAPVTGDPDMVILNPEEYNIKQITLFASFVRTVQEFYLNVFMKTSGVSTFKINGVPANAIWKQMGSNPAYSYAQIPYSNSTSLTLSADEGFNAMAYGFGNVESYAYSAGTNLAVSNFLKLTNVNANVTGDDGCIGQPLTVKVILPGAAKTLNWKFEDASLNKTVTNPVATITTSAEGILQYEYVYPGRVTYGTLGTHRVTLNADLEAGLNPCTSGNVTYTYDFEIVQPEIFLPDVVKILPGGVTNIKGSTKNLNLTYKWSPQTGLSDPSIINPNVSTTHDQLYTLTATSDLGCITTAEVLVQVVDSFDIPNTFSPNGDGINDVWNLQLLNTYLNSLVEVFNRNGEKVFSSIGYANPFDGNYQGKALPVGTYYYIITPRNGKQNKTGPLTIIR
ncbi:gliding motility-associated C-terminal domain-containing protein [Pedobacter duraquae]|uniref:gliding motility-associated C-terminal domain-containing protein n=1 Tax=Pedobacter duraquae TaxID=425511 RepID=UPI001414FB04|nr:gliding motility-associated C-terminal domain-containing protein [Pedobacter duraquae]